MRVMQAFLCTAALLFSMACASKPADETAAGASGQAAGGKAAAAPFKSVSVPAGTVLTVRLDQAIGTATSHSGDEFAATLEEAVQTDGAVAIPQGAAARGIVEEAVPKGRLKGAARLRISLKSITVNGTSYPIETAAVARSAKGKGKRSAVMAGGGAGLGALIGGLAGGGRGAAIGAVAGAGAGTAGAAYTGNRDITFPAESALSFKLLQPVELKK